MLPSTEIHKPFGERERTTRHFESYISPTIPYTPHVPTSHTLHHNDNLLFPPYHLITNTNRHTSKQHKRNKTTGPTTAVPPPWQLHHYRRSLSPWTNPTGSGSAAPVSPSTRTDCPSLVTKDDLGRQTKATWSAETALCRSSKMP